MEESLRKQQGSDLLFRGLEAKRSGHFEQALQFYEESRRVYPYEPNIYKNASKIHLGLGNFNEALQYTIIRAHLLLGEPCNPLDLYMVNDRYTADPYYTNYLKFDYEGLINFCVRDYPEWSRVIVDNDNLSVAGIAYLMHPTPQGMMSVQTSSLRDLLRSPCRIQYQRMALGLPPNGPTFTAEEWKAVDVLGFVFVQQNISRYPFKYLMGRSMGLPSSSQPRRYSPDPVDDVLNYYFSEKIEFDFRLDD